MFSNNAPKIPPAILRLIEKPTLLKGETPQQCPASGPLIQI